MNQGVLVLLVIEGPFLEKVSDNVILLQTYLSKDFKTLLETLCLFLFAFLTLEELLKSNI